MGDIMGGGSGGGIVGGLLGGAPGAILGGMGLNKVGGALGLNGSAYSPAYADIKNPTTEGQVGTAYNQTQSGLEQQQAFVDALKAQNGIQNQSDVYNQLSGVVNGTGPNPAQAALNQATQANIANQAALMAGQRGAGANAGLLARQAAMQGGNLQQQAIGQGATMQAQQALNALNMQGGLATQQVGQQASANNAYNQAAQGQQANLLGGIAAQNNANVAMTSNANNAGTDLEKQKVAGKQSMLGGVMQGIGSAVALAHGGVVPHYDSGGQVSGLDTSAIPQLNQLIKPTLDANKPQSTAGKFFNGLSQNNPAGAMASQGSGPAALQQGASALFGGLAQGLKNRATSAPSAEDVGGVTGGSPMAGGPLDAGSAFGDAGVMFGATGGKVPAMVSPGEVYLPPNKAQAVAKGKANPMDGERIPGKAAVKGDSLKNDTVPKTLEAGGVVIPRSIMESKDAAKKAAKFVAAHLAKNQKSLPKKA